MLKVTKIDIVGDYYTQVLIRPNLSQLKQENDRLAQVLGI